MFFALFLFVGISAVYLAASSHLRAREFKAAVYVLLRCICLLRSVFDLIAHICFSHRSIDVGLYRKTSEYAFIHTEMSRYMKRRKNACGIVASNFRYYVNYAVVRSADGNGFEEMFNLRILRIHDKEKTSLVREVSSMCKTGHMSTDQVNRSGIITVEYQNFAGLTTTREVAGSLSFCLQHYVDILKGEWPCLPGQVRIPVYPKYAHKPHGEL